MTATIATANPSTENSTPDRSKRKLSEVTKKLAYPRSKIVATGWNETRQTCDEKLGITFDGWQDGLGTIMLAEGSDGKLVHTVGGFHLSAMRQVGKTYFFAGGLFGLSVDNPGLLTVWSAHHSKTHNETFLAMQAFCSRIRIAPYIANVYTGSGDEAVVFHNGSRILFGARERGFGRGIPGVDILVSDEGQIMSEKAMQNMLATMNTSSFGLHVYAGTPPATEEIHKAESWMRARNEAWIDGKDGPPIVDTQDVVWAEIGAEDGLDLDDPQAWAANPSFPHRTPVESIMRLRRKLNDAGFNREGLGRYDEDEGSEFDVERWKTLAVNADEPERAALVLDVTPDGCWSSIGIAADLPLSSAVELERQLVITTSQRGTKGIVKLIGELREKHNIIDIAITNGAARALETDLTRATIEYEVMTASDMSAAYANLQKMIKEGTVAHVGQEELTFALANAKSRYLQTGEAQAFDRREYSVDVSPAVAAAGALYRWGLNNAPLPLIM